MHSAGSHPMSFTDSSIHLSNSVGDLVRLAGISERRPSRSSGRDTKERGLEPDQDPVGPRRRRHLRVAGQRP